MSYNETKQFDVIILGLLKEGIISPDDVAHQLMKLINSIGFLSPNFWKMGDESRKNIDTESDFLKSEHSRFLSWVKPCEKPEIKKYVDYDAEDLIAAVKLATTQKK